MAVADKYVIQMQTPANKFARPTETLAEFIEQYVAGVSAVMNHIIKQVQCCADDNECCPNFYYFHFLSQVRMYYPGAREKWKKYSARNTNYGRRSYRRQKRAVK